VSKETVRAQLKRALAKTETHSQAQFVAVIARSLAMLRRP
jgi:DNA-binding CsgD family transcriptional regulator